MDQKVTKSKPVLKKEKTRELLLDIAAKMFSRQGYRLTSLKEIAAAADMKAGSLYYHFASKEALMIEVLDQSIQFISDTVAEELEKLGENYSFEVGLKAFIRGHLTAILEHPDYTTATIRNNGQLPSAIQKVAHAKRDDYEQIWRTLMVQGKTEGVIRKELDEQLFRLMVLGSLNWSSIWYNPNSSSIDNLVRQFTETFLKGCR